MNTLEGLKERLMIKPTIDKQKQFTVAILEKMSEEKDEGSEEKVKKPVKKPKTLKKNLDILTTEFPEDDTDVGKKKKISKSKTLKSKK